MTILKWALTKDFTHMVLMVGVLLAYKWAFDAGLV